MISKNGGGHGSSGFSLPHIDGDHSVLRQMGSWTLETLNVLD
jgi:hypothetical protein